MMSILEEAKIILTNCGLGCESIVQIAGRKIPRSVVRLSIICCVAGTVIMEGVLCVNGYDNGFAVTLYSFSILLTFLSGALIYSSLILKSHKIIELFNYLENVIHGSND